MGPKQKLLGGISLSSCLVKKGCCGISHPKPATGLCLGAFLGPQGAGHRRMREVRIPCDHETSASRPSQTAQYPYGGLNIQYYSGGSLS